MSIFGKIRALFAPRADIGSAEIKRGDGVWEALGGGTSAPTEYSALQVTAVYACVSLISGAISSMPMHVYRRAQDGDLSRDMNSELWWILNEQFSPRWAASAGWSFLVASKLLYGNGYSEILRDMNGGIKGLMPIHPRRVLPIVSPDGMRLVYQVSPDPTIIAPASTGMRIIPQDDMLDVAGFGYNGLRGLSVLKSALAVSGRLAISAQDFSSGFLQNLGRPDYALKAKGNLTDAQFDRLREMIAQHTGPDNGGKPMLLEGDMDLQTLTMPLEEMQLLETRKFQVEEIARAFGVPPFMIGHTEKTSSWGTGVAAMGAGFVRFALRDHLNAFQNEINRKFFRTVSRVAEFDTTELERADLGVMMNAARVALGRAGEEQIMSVEEIRAQLRLPRKIQGTVRTVEPADPEPANDPDPAEDPNAPIEDTGAAE